MRAIRAPLNVVDGSVRFNFAGRERDIYALNEAELAAIRWRHLSYILQGSMNVLNPVRRVRQSFVDFAWRHIGKPMPEFLRLVEGHLARLRLEPAILDSYPHELSGGMRQRVTIALASVCRPDFIVADEPTTALDVVVQKDVLALLREVQREIRSSMILVTHDIGVHANVTDRLGIMYAGRLVEEGRTVDVIRNPRHPYTAHLVSSLPRIGDTTQKKGLEGSPPNLAAPPPGCRFHPRCPLAMDICRKEHPPMVEVGPPRRLLGDRASGTGWRSHERAAARCQPRRHDLCGRRAAGAPRGARGRRRQPAARGRQAGNPRGDRRVRAREKRRSRA